MSYSSGSELLGDAVMSHSSGSELLGHAQSPQLDKCRNITLHFAPRLKCESTSFQPGRWVVCNLYKLCWFVAQG